MAIYILSGNDVKSIARGKISPDYYGPIISVSDGNKKLKSTAGMYNETGEYIPSTKWLIFNTPAVVTCPFRTRMCGGYLRGEKRFEVDEKTGKIIDKKAECYAVKAESAYPSVIPARRDNLRASLMPGFVEAMTAIILKTAKNMKKERLIVRIHESGDFYNKKYADMWLKIARNVAHDIRIVFWCYTKSFVFFDGVQLPENFKLRASVWADTTPEQLEIIARNGWPIYTVYESELPAGYNECFCKDCANCNQCGDMSIKSIACKKH
jgi:hypothetical protein